MFASNLSRIAIAVAVLVAARPVALNSQTIASSRSNSGPVVLSSLRPTLLWQRTSPPRGHVEGPVLYQLLFTTSGTPGVLAKFDTNPRHLTNSLIADNGNSVTVGTGNTFALASTGVITFASGQSFSGNGLGMINVNAAQLNGLTSAAFAPASGSPNYVAKSGDTMTGGLQLASAGTGGAQVLSSPPLDLTDSQPCSSGTRCSGGVSVQTFRWEADPLGGMFGSPSGSLNLLVGGSLAIPGGINPPVATGLAIDVNGGMTIPRIVVPTPFGGFSLDANGIGTVRSLSVLNIAPRNGGTPAFNYGSQDAGNPVFQMFADSSVPGGTQDTFRMGTIVNVPLLLATNGLSNTRVFIGTDGSVGIGTSAPTAMLTVAPAGTTLADAWTTRSSARLKMNIQPLIGALPKIEKLRGVSYDLKSNGKHDIGLIAEEVAQVVPEVVSFEADGKNAQGLDYARLTALLIEGMKQQQRQIRRLQKEVSDLRARR